MVSYLSIIWALFFFGLGGWFFYYVLRNNLRTLKFTKRIIKPNIDNLNKEIEAYVTAIGQENIVQFKPIFEKLLYLKILVKDIVLLRRIVFQQKDLDSKNILVRSLALQLYEYYNDINNLYDKQFDHTISKILPVEMGDAMKILKKMNALFKTQYSEKLKTIRLNVIGHRDFDSVKQHNIINELNTKEILEISQVVLLMIYLFTVYNVTFFAKYFIGARINIFNVTPFDKYKWDMEMWTILTKEVERSENASS